MARTKKQPVVEEQKVESTPKTSTISYTGKVTVKFMRNNKTLKTIRKHNSGCKALFDFITNCLCSNYEASGVPFYLMGFNLTGTAWEPAMSTPVPVVNAVPSYASPSNLKSTVTYKFIIPSASIIVTPLNLFALYSGGNVAYSTTDIANSYASAFVELKGNSIIDSQDIPKGVSVIVIWEMSFENKPSE